MEAVELTIRAPELLGSLLRSVRARIIVQQTNVVEFLVLFADLMSQSVHLRAINLGSTIALIDSSLKGGFRKLLTKY